MLTPQVEARRDELLRAWERDVLDHRGEIAQYVGFVEWEQFAIAWGIGHGLSVLQSGEFFDAELKPRGVVWTGHRP